MQASQTVTCTSCVGEITHDLHPPYDTNLNCGHAYCNLCLGRFFQSRIESRRLPVECCGNVIDGEAYLRFLARYHSDHDAEKCVNGYRRRLVECNTADRTYCHDFVCGLFILPATIHGRRATCEPGCGKATCSQCKKEYHHGPCRDEPYIQLEALAAREGWKQCGGCRNMVELAEGCYHMTCRCRHQFCYLCGAEWKTCRCPQFAPEQNAAAAAAHGMDEGQFIDLIQEEAQGRQRWEQGQQRIMAEHAACNHPDHWDRWGDDEIPDPHCDLCHRYTDGFIHVCPGCGQRRCERCLHLWRTRRAE